MCPDRPRPRRVLIVNTHSTLNSGDTAIVLGQIALLRAQDPGVEITLTSRTPRLDRNFYRRSGVRVIPPLFHTPAGFAGKNRGRLAALLSLLLPWNALRYLFCARRADLVAAAGGGYFYTTSSSRPGLTWRQNEWHLRLALRLGKPLLFFPQSFGPFADPGSAARLLAVLAHPGTRGILVRETISRDLLQELAAKSGLSLPTILCPDMAFSHCPQAAADPLPDHLPRPRLALALRDWAFPGADAQERARAREEYLLTMVEVCRRFRVRHGGSIVLYSQVRGPAAAEDDRRLTAEILGRLAAELPATVLYHHTLPESAHPDEIVALLARCDLLLASRLHAVILSVLAGTPALALGYLPKSRGVMRELGLEDACLEITAARVDDVERRLEELLARRAEWPERCAVLRRRLREETARACAGLFDRGGI